MLAVDVAGALNPALTNQAFTRPASEPNGRAEKPEPVSNTTKTEAAATGSQSALSANVAEFKPVVGPSQPTQQNLPNTYKSSSSNLDVLL
ncbi:hypothetical protein [Mobiluncus mulieris]|uniref:Uncharacterized protein n=1 Tax=Mobiluncus mulieris TaxID=2052 RepID=A0A7Y0YIZ8_9ACTO|nr:hypothetical protein [Mobiluncus mulieris]NMX04349.1 hypothetical protein [Mobiluncus mulieris]NMX12288.1 hypothetical protein [Mobiluncus mulieris]